jgi:hypothetical protein
MATGVACEVGFQHMTDTDVDNAAMKHKEDKEGGEDESEEGQSSEFVSHSMALQCIVTASVREASCTMSL